MNLEDIKILDEYNELIKEKKKIDKRIIELPELIKTETSTITTKKAELKKAEERKDEFKKEKSSKTSRLKTINKQVAKYQDKLKEIDTNSFKDILKQIDEIKAL